MKGKELPADEELFLLTISLYTSVLSLCHEGGRGVSCFLAGHVATSKRFYYKGRWEKNIG